MYKIIQKEMYDCFCDRCKHNWTTDKLPIACSKCKTRSWNIKPRKKKNA